MAIRWLLLSLFLALTGALFFFMIWPRAMLGLAGLNLIACIVFWLKKEQPHAYLAGITFLLFFATLFFTDWGLSSAKPVVRVAWPYLVMACILELILFSCWIFKRPKEKES